MNDFQRSDSYHVQKFCNFKFGFLYKIPIIGTILFLALFKSTAGANIVDSKFYEKILLKGFRNYVIINSVNYFFLIILNLLILFLWGYNWEYLKENIYFFRQLAEFHPIFNKYFPNIFFSIIWIFYYCFSQFWTIKKTKNNLINLVKDFEYFEKEEIVYNAKITNPIQYIKKYLEQKTTVPVELKGSDNFEFISERKIIKYENSNRQKEENNKKLMSNSENYATSIKSKWGFLIVEYSFLIFQKYNFAFLKEILKYNNYKILNKQISFQIFLNFTFYI